MGFTGVRMYLKEALLGMIQVHSEVRFLYRISINGPPKTFYFASNHNWECKKKNEKILHDWSQSTALFLIIAIMYTRDSCIIISFVTWLLMGFHLQVFCISTSFVPRVMFSLVEHVMDEISRLFQCVPEFSRNGALQVSGSQNQRSRCGSSRYVIVR